jgi:hypothetical protein
MQRTYSKFQLNRSIISFFGVKGLIFSLEITGRYFSPSGGVAMREGKQGKGRGRGFV